MWKARRLNTWRSRLINIRDFKIQRRDAAAKKTSLKKWICVLSVFSYPPTLSNVGEPSWSWIPRDHIQISLLLVHVLHKTWNQAFSRRGRAKTGKEMNKKAWCTCKVVVFLNIKPIVFWRSRRRQRRWILKSLLGSLNNDDGFFDVLVADVRS